MFGDDCVIICIIILIVAIVDSMFSKKESNRILVFCIYRNIRKNRTCDFRENGKDVSLAHARSTKLHAFFCIGDGGKNKIKIQDAGVLL